MWARVQDWLRKWRPERVVQAVVPTVQVPPPVGAVLGVTVEPPRLVPALPERTLRFRDMEWRQRGKADASGLVTFVRDIVVDGRLVQSELQLAEADLTQQPDGTWALNGRA